jgi:diguanylate cyclase (GGDEF)-like protein/PAS domain S-box-containing protein
MPATDFLSRMSPRALPTRLARLYGRSLYGAMLLMVFGGLAIPAVLGGYLLIGVQEREAARARLDASLQRNADILALGMQESLWNMNADAARSLVDSLMRDPAMVHVHVQAQSEGDFIDQRAGTPQVGHLLRAEREVVVHGQPIGRVLVELDDSRSQQELRAKQWRYAMVLAGQLAVSLLLIALLLKRRLVAPLRALMGFSDRLSQGKFDTPLALKTSDELGRLGSQMERMRIAIGELFKDIGWREERFRTIVTQVPGAVFRAQPNGKIDFVSEAIEAITGYPSRHFVNWTTARWADILCPEDRRGYYHAVKDAVAAGRRYEVEYRIVDANGIERWLLESGQPVGFEGQEAYWVDGIISDISERKDNEMRIEALLAEQGAVLDNVMFGILHVRERRVVSTNRRFDTLFGYPEGELVGDSIVVLFADAAEYEHALTAAGPAVLRGEDYSEERQFRRRDGSLFWCSVSGRVLDPERPDGDSIWVYADVTERRQAEEKLRLSATVLEHIADGVMVLDVHGRIVATNPAYTQITGYTEAEALGTQSSLTRDTGQDEAFHEALWRDLAETGFWRGETWSRRKNGEAYLEWLTVSSVRDDLEAVTHYVCVFSDITKVKESQDKLDHLAHHDPLTGLPNRLLFHDRLQHAMVRAARSNLQLAVLFIDLDRFKTVNDTLGHHVGDELLKQVAGGLSACLREDDTLARLGGDEFIVLLEDVEGARGARMVAEKLMAQFERPLQVAGHELYVTGSVGISLFPNDAIDLNVLIRNADVAMYQAKARGRNGYQFYAPSMDGDGVERLRMEALLRRAIEKGEIRVVYQPQVDIGAMAGADGGARGRLVGVEALVRWHSPELGEVPPGRFIPLAEDIGFIAQLGKLVLDQACRQMVAWERAGLAVPKIAVNLSGRQFDRGDIAASVGQVLRETGLAPRRLQLEVTESVIMNTGDALQTINALHAIGVELAIDDFGTGYSSLAYLKQLPVQTLKIDRSFIKDIPRDTDDEAIAIAIIQLGKSMGLSVIAEGVESEEQGAFLLRHGCSLAQGYLYGRPMAPERLLEQWGRQRDA